MFLRAKVREILDRPTRQDLGPPQAVSPASATAMASPVLTVSAGQRILVIDDDDAVRGLLRNILSSAGYIVLEAGDGKAGLAQLDGAPIDLVVTDLVMPEQEGLEILRKLHAQRPGLPVIAVSGAFDGSFLRVARCFGAVDALAKPVDSDALLRAVQLALASRNDCADAGVHI